MIRLVLFDVDGTLCDTGGAGKRAFLAAAEEVLGCGIDGGRIEFAGRTDLAILYDILALVGVSSADPPLIESILSHYLERLDVEMTVGPPGRAYPGIPEILSRLGGDPEFAVGLLTGNIEPAAHRKLAHFGIAGAFGFGAFGDDHADRDRLVPIARQRAIDRIGLEASDATIAVIGDTPHDIRCARAGSAAAVAVATGFCDVETLARHAPDALLPDMSRTDEVHELLRRLTDPLR